MDFYGFVGLYQIVEITGKPNQLLFKDITMITNTYLRILDEITPSLNYIPSKEEYIAYYKNITKQ